MSRYYTAKVNSSTLKVRVSDHEPNEALRGSSDVELYVKSADNQLLSIEAQIERICDKRDYDISAFAHIIEEWKDGTYTKDYFTSNDDDVEDVTPVGNAWNIKVAKDLKDEAILKDITLMNKSGKEMYAEIKKISEITGVSQQKIKKHFNVR